MSTQEKAKSPYVGDEHWGKGGRFAVDITTGRRVPVIEVDGALVVAIVDDNPADVQETEADKAKSVKEKKRA